MIWRGNAAPGQRLQVGACQKGRDFRAGAQVDHRHGGIAVTGMFGGDIAHRAAQDGQHIGCGTGRGRRGARRGLAVGGKPFLDHVILGNQPRIGFFGIVSKGEMAVVEQDQPLDRGILIEHIRRRAAQVKTGLEERHHAHSVAEYLADHGARIRQVCQRDHRGCVGMVDETVRQEGMQQAFDRRIGAGGVEHGAAQRVHHVRVFQPVQPAQRPHRVKPQAGHAGRSDCRQVMTRALNVQHVAPGTEQVRPHYLDRGIAAAMQHQVRVRPDQPRGIYLQRQSTVSLGFAGLGDEICRLGVYPFVFCHDAPVN